MQDGNPILKTIAIIILICSTLLRIYTTAQATTSSDKSSTITVDGNIDEVGSEWASDEKFTTFVGSFDAFFITWDNTDLYFGFDGGGSTDRYVIAIDTDPGGSNGRSNEWGGVTFPLYGRPDFIVEYKNGSLFGDNVNTGNVTASRDNGLGELEIKIPRSELGSLGTGAEIGVYMWAGYDNSGAKTFAFFPGTSTNSYGNSVSASSTVTPVSEWHFPTTDSGRAPTTYGRYQSHIFLGKSVTASDNDLFNDIILDSGTLNGPASGTIKVAGNFQYESGTFNLNSCTVNFNDSGGITGSHTTGVTFNHVTIDSGKAVTASANFIVQGNWTNSGAFTASSGTAKFGGGGAQAVSGVSTFYNLTVDNSGGTTSFGSSSITIANTFRVDGGTMDGGTSTFTFTGASGAIAGANAKRFYNLVVNNGASISNSAGGNIEVGNNYTNNGTFAQATGKRTTFTGVSQSLAGSGATTFGDVTVQGTSTLDAGSHNFSVGGSTFQVSSGGAFSGGTSTVTFNGSGVQTLSGGGSASFNNLTIASGATLDTVLDPTVSGTLTSNGAVRKTQTIASTGALSFGLTNVSMNVDSFSLAPSITVDRTDGDHPSATTGIGGSSEMYWSITSSGTFQVDVTFSDSTISGTGTQRTCRTDDNGASWDCQVDADGNDSNASTTRNNVTAFSDWQNCKGCGPTAVTLTGFAARGAVLPAVLVGIIFLLAFSGSALLQRIRHRYGKISRRSLAKEHPSYLPPGRAQRSPNRDDHDDASQRPPRQGAV